MSDNAASFPARFFTRDSKGLSVAAYAFLAFLCLCFFVPGLASLPPTDRDESSFAQASKQMVETGNYTDIRLQKEPRYKKPIGIYWLQSAAVRSFSPEKLNEIWAYRLPSLAGATLAVLMTAALGTLLFSPMAGFFAAVMMADCVLLNVEARLAKTDAALLGSIMVAMYPLARAYLGKAAPWRDAIVFWTAVAMGVLIKGPIILLPIAGVLLTCGLADKTLAWVKTLRPGTGIVYALALIAPWFIAISMQSHGAFMHQSAGNDLLAKLWQGQNRGIMPPGLHLLVLPVVFFPFSLFVVLAAPDMWKNRREAAVKFCLGWAVPAWIVFECSLTKLPHYVLPVYPALALLTAKFLLDGLPTAVNATRRLPIVLITGFWLTLGVCFALVFTALPAMVDHTWKTAPFIAGIALMLAQAVSLFMLPKNKVTSMAALTLGSLIFMTTTFGAILPGLQHLWISREIVEAVAPVKPCPQTQIITAGYHEPSLAFLAGTDTFMAANGGEAAQALHDQTCSIAAIGPKQKQAFFDFFADSGVQPREVGAIEGLNSGHGAQTAMTLYLLPVVKP